VIRGRLFTIACALTLMLCVATLALWAQGNWQPVTYLLSSQPTRTVFVASARGRLRVWSQQIAPAPPAWVVATLTTPDEVEIGVLNGASGGVRYNPPDKLFEWSARRRISLGSIGTYKYTVFEWHFQLAWWLAALLSFLPAIFMLRMRLVRRRRALVGHCLGCGYNLTGNASGICPECGTAINPRDQT
jgi:hypothetical protein